MHKQIFHIEKLRKVTLYGISLIGFLIISLVILLQTAYIQTKIAQYIANELSIELKTEITIGKAKISLFRGVEFKDIFIKDQQNDTLIFINQLSVIPSGLQTDFNNLSFNNIKVDQLYFNLYEIQNDTLNIGFLLNYFKNDKQETDSKDFQLKINNFEISDSKFRYFIPDSTQKPGFNPKNIVINNLSISLSQFILNNDVLTSEALNISLKEEKGFDLKKLTSDFVTISPDFIKLKQFTILTNKSILKFDSLNLDYPNSYDFSNAAESLNSNISIHPSSYIAYNDIKFFINDTSDFNETVNVSGKLNGCIDSFNFNNLKVNYHNIFDLKIQGEIKDLYSTDNPSFTIKVVNLATDIEEIKNINFKGKEHFLSIIPKQLGNIRTLNYFGETKGRLSDFVSYGEISGNFGSIIINASAKKDSLSGFNVKGFFSGNEIDLIQPTGNKDFGNLSFKQEIDFTLTKNKKFNLITFGKIEEITYNNYTYRDIDLYAKVNNKRIDSLGILINQPEIEANITGNADFGIEIPEINFIADVKKADLKHLNIEKAKRKSEISFCLNAFFNGITIDDFTGMAMLSKPLHYQRDTSSILVSYMELSGNMIKINDEITKKIELSSNIADFTLLSYGKTSETMQSFKTFITGLFEVKADTMVIFTDTVTKGYLTVEGIIKSTNEITKLYFPYLNISNNALFSGNYNPGLNIFNFSFNASEVSYKTILIKDFYTVAYTRENRFYAGTGGSSLKAFEPVFIENINFEGDFKNDSLSFNMSWNNYNDTSFYAGDINGMMTLTKTNLSKAYIFSFTDSKIILKENIWQFTNSKLLIDSAKMTVSDLSFKNNNQEIYIDGNISENPGDFLFTRFNNFDIQNLNDLLTDDLKITGKLFGSAIFAQLYENPLIFTKDSVVDLSINDIDFGNFYFNSNWDDKNNKIHTNAYNLKGSKKQFMNDTIFGDYWPDQDSISIMADIKSMTLQTFKQYFDEYIEFNNTAYVTGNINLFGNINQPQYTCNLKLKQTSVRIKYLNTINTLEEPEFYIDNKIIKIKDTKLKSNHKTGYADLYGTITHKNFSDLFFDINLKANNYILTDINHSDSSYFWGKSFASGIINVSGPMNNIMLDAEISTDKNTTMFIPISSTESLSEENNFIRFVQDTSEKINKDNYDNYKFETNGFSMNIKLNVTPDAEISIIPDESTGNIITKGEGKITLNLSREGDFSMFGTYIITEGQYNFNYRSIFNEKFIIQDNSRLEWFGKPEDANINLTAFSSVKNASLKDLNINETETRKTDVTCFIEMTGTLISPDLKLYIRLPENFDQDYTQRINALPENEMNEQFFSLLLIGSFLPLSGTVSNEYFGQSTELLETALNSVLKKTGYDISVRYETSENENYSDRYRIQFSQKFWEDRIEFKGNVGIGGKEISSTDGEKYLGEFEIQAKLNQKGTIRLKGYNVANTKNENEGDYTQGAGIVWRGKYNSLFFRRKHDKENTVYKDSVKIYKLNVE